MSLCQRREDWAAVVSISPITRDGPLTPQTVNEESAAACGRPTLHRSSGLCPGGVWQEPQHPSPGSQQPRPEQNPRFLNLRCQNRLGSLTVARRRGAGSHTPTHAGWRAHQDIGLALWASLSSGLGKLLLGLGLQPRCPNMAQAFRFRGKASPPTGDAPILSLDKE